VIGEGQEDCHATSALYRSLRRIARIDFRCRHARRRATHSTADTRSKQILEEGRARSETFRALVNRIEASQVIVYVATYPLIKKNLSGTLTWMTQAGGFRYVRASISPDLLFHQAIATVAHELRHAVEVIEDQTVYDEKSLVAMYRRIGHRSRSTSAEAWETADAQETGWQVRRELVSPQMPAVSRTGERTHRAERGQDTLR